MIKLVIFDLDGTLLYTIGDLADSVNYALTKYGMPNVTLQEATANVGNGVKNLISLCAPEGTDEKTLNEILAAFKAHYKDNMENKTVPYDGIVEMLEELRKRDVKTAVLSNKFDAATKRLCENLLPDLIDIPVGEREGVPRKPSPDAVELIINECGVSKNECAIVGDSDTDIITGKNAGIKTVAVTWGYRPKEVLEKAFPDKIANTVNELQTILAE